MKIYIKPNIEKQEIELEQLLTGTTEPDQRVQINATEATTTDGYYNSRSVWDMSSADEEEDY